MRAWLLTCGGWRPAGRSTSPSCCCSLLIEAGASGCFATLGERWTTRIIVVPGETLVARGPYRFVSHPNYLVVIGEIAVLPLVFGLWQVALIFSLLNAAILAIRIRAENRRSPLTLLLATLERRAYMAATLLDIVKALRLGPEGPAPRGFDFERCRLTDTAAIARLIEPAVKELGFDLVRVAMIGGTSDPTLQVMAERPDTRQLTIDDCSDISRKLSDLLDAEEAAPRPDRGRLPARSQSRPASTGR